VPGQALADVLTACWGLWIVAVIATVFATGRAMINAQPHDRPAIGTLAGVFAVAEAGILVLLVLAG
jgi:hypothetical protein